MKKVLLSIPDQVTQALDGRTQRWLSLKIQMPEDELSKRMKGKKEFSDDEIEQINLVLDSKIKR